jgi:hypothetical protein
VNDGASASTEDLDELVRFLASWTWPLSEADSIALLQDYGWSSIDHDPGKGEIYETGFVSERSWATVGLLDGNVREVRIFTSVVVNGDSAEDQRFVTDTFADQVRVATDTLGTPTEVSPGPDGAATWAMASGSELQVRRSNRSCVWAVESPYYAELKRDVRRIGG